MKLKILGCGTSTGVPIPGCRCAVCRSGNPKNFRSRTSALLSTDDNLNILIDTTPDFRYQALAADISHINAVLFTHAHADHIFGLDDLRGFNYVQRASIPCYASRKTLEHLKQTFSYIFSADETYEGGQKPQLDLFEIRAFQPLSVCNVTIQPFALQHGNMPVLGFRIGDLAYATDCKVIPPESRELLRGIKTLVLDGLRYEPHKTHLSIPEACKVAEELNVQQTFLVHMTHTVDFDEVSAQLPANVRLAYDGLEIDF